jgi:hypothetical protein
VGAAAVLWCGAVAQLGERLVRNEEVSGSIPLSSTNESFNDILESTKVSVNAGFFVAWRPVELRESIDLWGNVGGN